MRKIRKIEDFCYVVIAIDVLYAFAMAEASGGPANLLANLIPGFIAVAVIAACDYIRSVYRDVFRSRRAWHRQIKAIETWRRQSGMAA